MPEITRHNLRVRHSRPRKVDKGHSIVRTERWSTDSFGVFERQAIVCQCGKKYTGNGDRAYYSWDAHRKAATS